MKPRRLRWLVVLVSVALVAACSGESDPTDAPAAAASTATAPPAATPSAAVTRPAEPTISAATSPRPTLPAEDAPPVRGGSLVYAVEAESLDGFLPSTARFAVAGKLMAQTFYDPLAAVDAEGVVRPFLAQSIEPNADFTRWTITLPPGVVFHNGDELRAEHVRAHLQGVLSGPLAATIDSGISDIRVVGDLVLEVDTPSGYASFPLQLTGTLGLVAHPDQYADPDGARHPIGTGAFVFDDWDIGQRLRVVRNEHYWRPGLPYLDAIEFRPIADPLARVAALRSGDVDALHLSDPSEISGLRSDADELTVIESDRDAEVTFLLFNTAAGPGQDGRLRRAMALAIDYDEFLELRTNGTMRRARSPLGPGSLGYLGDPAFPDHDPDAARALVDEVERESGPVRVTFSHTPTGANKLDADLFVDYWRDVGIEVSTEAYDQPTLVNRALVGDFEVAYWRQYGGADPDILHLWWLSENAAPVGALSLNLARFQSPELDAALRAGRATADRAERAAAYEDLNRVFAREVPAIWLFYQAWLVASDRDVVGLGGGTLPDGTPLPVLTAGHHRFDAVWIRPAG
jgi:peptide/nickel transport system substrate-binding protein